MANEQVPQVPVVEEVQQLLPVAAVPVEAQVAVQNVPAPAPVPVPPVQEVAPAPVPLVQEVICSVSLMFFVKLAFVEFFSFG